MLTGGEVSFGRVGDIITQWYRTQNWTCPSVGGLWQDNREYNSSQCIFSQLLPPLVHNFLSFLQGIPIDIHMCRIFNALEWADSRTKNGFNAQKTSQQMESWFPKEHWPSLNETYAGLGQLLNDSGTRRMVTKFLMEEAKKRGHCIEHKMKTILKEYKCEVI